jgi:hypothetical protein
MVHTMVTIMYALNILSRYGNNLGPRHIEFLKHLLRYVKYSRADRLMFRTHNGSKDIKTMTALTQLRFQCDADLGENLDNKHSQSSYLVICLPEMSSAGVVRIKAAYPQAPLSPRSKLSITHSRLRLLQIDASST